MNLSPAEIWCTHGGPREPSFHVTKTETPTLEACELNSSVRVRKLFFSKMYWIVTSTAGKYAFGLSCEHWWKEGGKLTVHSLFFLNPLLSCFFLHKDISGAPVDLATIFSHAVFPIYSADFHYILLWFCPPNYSLGFSFDTFTLFPQEFNWKFGAK